MRIIQFPKLIVTEETQPIKLKNCSVVIDGNNFLHFMYEDSNIPYVFGGEMNEFSKFLKQCFYMFQQANVKCYVVLKGGDTDIERKIKKFQHLIFDFDCPEYVPPIAVKDVWSQTLDEMKMTNAVCVTESKDDCVAVAIQLDCPIIANDISYCFRKAAYIPFTQMKLNKRTKCIECRQYTLHNFLQKHNLTEEKAAIFASLSDRLLFPQNYFDTILQNWGVLHTNLYLQNKKLILWLSSHSEQDVRDAFSTSLSSDDQNKFWENYHKILTSMRKQDGGFTTDYLIHSKLTINNSDPEWFEKGVVCKHIPLVYVNLYKYKVIEGSWCVEDKSSRDSLLLSIDIIKYIYNLLTDFQIDTIKLYQDVDNFIEIDTHDPNVLKPYSIPGPVFKYGWNVVKKCRLFEHFLNINNILTGLLDELPADARVLFVALVYFARKKIFEDNDVTSEVYAIVLSYVMLSVVQDWGSQKEYHQINAVDRLQAKRVTAKYFSYNSEEAKNIFDGEALKRFVEFQFCLEHINNLNTLCGTPYKTAWYSRIYNGTFIFKIFCDIKRRDRDGFVDNLFQTSPTVLAFVQYLITTYNRLFTAGN